MKTNFAWEGGCAHVPPEPPYNQTHPRRYNVAHASIRMPTYIHFKIRATTWRVRPLQPPLQCAAMHMLAPRETALEFASPFPTTSLANVLERRRNPRARPGRARGAAAAAGRATCAAGPRARGARGAAACGTAAPSASARRGAHTSKSACAAAVAAAAARGGGEGAREAVDAGGDGGGAGGVSSPGESDAGGSGGGTGGLSAATLRAIASGVAMLGSRKPRDQAAGARALAEIIKRDVGHGNTRKLNEVQTAVVEAGGIPLLVRALAGYDPADAVRDLCAHDVQPGDMGCDCGSWCDSAIYYAFEGAVILGTAECCGRTVEPLAQCREPGHNCVGWGYSPSHRAS
jgi:hypothetical protein